MKYSMSSHSETIRFFAIIAKSDSRLPVVDTTSFPLYTPTDAIKPFTLRTASTSSSAGRSVPFSKRLKILVKGQITTLSSESTTNPRQSRSRLSTSHKLSQNTLFLYLSTARPAYSPDLTSFLCTKPFAIRSSQLNLATLISFDYLMMVYNNNITLIHNRDDFVKMQDFPVCIPTNIQHFPI